MKNNKGQAIVEMAILVVLVVVMLQVSLQITKYLEALQKTQSAAYFAAQAWSIERPRYYAGASLETEPEWDSVQTDIEERVRNFLEDKDLEHTTGPGENFSVNFGTSSVSPRVEIENTVNIDFPWYQSLAESVKPVKAKVDTLPYPVFHDYDRGY